MQAKTRALLLLQTCLLIATIATADSAADLLAQGRVDEAIASAQAQLSKSANDAASNNLLCRAYYQLEKWDEGIAACQKAVAAEPGNGLYHLWLGRVYGEKADSVSFLSAAGFAKKTRAEFETAVKLIPDNVEAHSNLAEYYVEAPGIMGGGKDKAEAEGQTLTKLSPAKGHWLKARIAEKDKEREAAENEYHAEIQTSQNSAEAWVDMANYYRHTDRAKEMADALEHVASAPADHSGAALDAAEMLVRSGRNIPTAVQLLKKYLASGAMVEDAPAFKAHYWLGMALEKQGDKPGAVQEYRASLAMAKEYSRAKEALKRVSNNE